MADQVADALERLQEHTGKRLGDDEDPLLVSVRSGARESMPGMLDTVLNLGLNDTLGRRPRQGHRERALRLGLLPALRPDVRQRQPRHRRRGASKEIARTSRATPGSRRTPISTSTPLKSPDRAASRRSYEEHTGEAFPQDPQEQLRLAIRAVFDSWTGDRAQAYRRINRIPDDWGTAVNVQQMVFGNKGDTSGSGVAFSRDEVTGAPEPSGDFLPNAQGEDVVSGARTRATSREMKEQHAGRPRAADRDPARRSSALRRHAGHRVHGGGGQPLHAPDAQRQAARAGRRCASRVDAVDEGLLDRDQALMTIDAEMLDRAARPDLRPQRRATR